MQLRYNQIMKLRPRVRALKLAAKVRQRLTVALGQPVKVIMFGSQARGDATKYSDIDLFVILPSLDDNARYLVSDITWEVGFEAGRVISAIPTTKEKMKQYGFLPLYRNVKKEGIPV
jgi:predicted nucleotidyltransferase